MTKTPDIWMLHTTNPREGESEWGGCYIVETDAHNDAATMRKVTGLDWEVVPMVRADSLGKCLHQIAEPAATPFMHGIADGCGNAYFEEGCVAPEAEDLQPEVDGLNSCLDDDEKPYSVVPLYTHPAQQGLPDDGLYYLQDARWSGMVGNCPSFWRPDGNGYTTNLDEAERFTHEEAMAQHRSRSTDLPWLCSEVDKLRRPTVDCQYMPRSWDAQRAALAAQAKQGGPQP